MARKANGVAGSVTPRLSSFAGLLGELALQGLLLAITDGGRLLEVLPLLPLADDSFFFHHSLEALDGLLKVFTVIYLYVGDLNHLPSVIRSLAQFPGRAV